MGFCIASGLPASALIRSGSIAVLARRSVRKRLVFRDRSTWGRTSSRRLRNDVSILSMVRTLLFIYPLSKYAGIASLGKTIDS